MPAESITRAALRALIESDLVGELAARMKEKYGWRMSQRAAHGRVLQMLNSGYGEQRHFPADDIEIVLELTGLDYVSPILAAASERGERLILQRRLDAIEDRGRLRMATVRPGQRDAGSREVG